MQQFIVGNPGSFHKGRWYSPGQPIRIEDDELPSITWTHPNGAPVEIEVKKKKDGSVEKTLKPAGQPPAPPKERTLDDEIDELEAKLEQLWEKKKAKERPALSQLPTPPKAPGVGDDSHKHDKQPKGGAPQLAAPSGRPSDQDPA